MKRLLVLVALVALTTTAPAESPEWEHKIVEIADKAFTVAVSPNHGMLAVVCAPRSLAESGRILLIRTSDFAVQAELVGVAGSSLPHILCFDRYSNVLYAPRFLASESTVVAWDIKNNVPMEAIKQIPMWKQSEAVAVNLSFHTPAPVVAVESQPGHVQFYDEAGLPVSPSLSLGFPNPKVTTTPVDHPIIAPTGDYFAATSGPDQCLSVVKWSYQKEKWDFRLVTKKPIKLPAYPWGVAVSPDGDTLVVSTPKGVTFFDVDRTKWTITENENRSLKEEQVQRVAFLSSGDLVTSGGMELAIHGLKTKTKTSLASFPKASGGMKSLAVASDGSAIYGVANRKVHVWKRTSASTGAAERP